MIRGEVIYLVPKARNLLLVTNLNFLEYVAQQQLID